jgi:DNA-binding response OmpR family regulator
MDFPERRVKPSPVLHRRLLQCRKADTNCSVHLLTICILSPDRPTMMGRSFTDCVGLRAVIASCHTEWNRSAPEHTVKTSPSFVLSIQTEEDHKVRFLRSGANDYVVKPFGMAELAARCEAALRRYHKALDKGPVVRTGPLTIDLVSRAMTLRSRYVTLTRQEYHLLHLLASHLGLVITHNQLINDIWGDTSSENVQYLRCLVRKLRQKIEADPSQPKLLMSETGIGYRLERHGVDDRWKPFGKMSENSQQLPAEIVRVGENRGVMAREKRSQTKKQRLLRAQHA